MSGGNVSCTALPRGMHLCRSSSNVPRLASFLKLLQNSHVWLCHGKRCSNDEKWSLNMWCFSHFDLDMYFAPQRRALFRHLILQKWSETACFNTFDLKMRYVPQRHALFQKLDFVSVSDPTLTLRCFYYFELDNVLRATVACTFSTSQLPKVLQDFQICFAPQQRAIFLGRLPSWLHINRCSEPTFDPPLPQNIGKTQCFATFLPFRASSSSF